MDLAWKVKHGIIYYGEKILQINPQWIFKKYGAEYPRIHRLEDLTNIFNRNNWVPDPTDLPPDA